MSSTSDKPVMRHSQNTKATSPATFPRKNSGMLQQSPEQEESNQRTTDQLGDISEQQTEKTVAIAIVPQDRSQILPTTVRTTKTLTTTTTRHLETGKQAIRIPATNKGPRKIEPRRKRSPLVHIGVILGILVIFSFTAFFVNPVDSTSQLSTIKETINNFFQGTDNTSINLVQRQASPTATLSLQTNEGYCGGFDIWGTCARASTTSGMIGTGVMQRPINGAVITQVFANPEYQFWCGCVKPHSGIDLAAAYGTPVQAADSGQVIWVGWDWSGLGNAVKISHGNYTATLYGHLARYIVQVGQTVSKGQTIAYEGNTGASTGPHLHFMIMVNNIWVNPTLYMTLP
jgi:murein DD-endopeptidase MepM/ murein hydrolase activator NlpD